MSAGAAEKFASFNWIRGVADAKRISIIHRFILIRLVVHRQKDGRCDPGYDPVAKELGVDRKTVMRAVDVGVRFGWLAPPIRGRRANANFVFLFPNQEVLSGGTSRADQEVPPRKDFSDNQEVPLSELRSPSKGVKKSLKKRASRAKSKASTGHGHLTGKENGQKCVSHDSPDDASLGKDTTELATGFEEFWQAYPEHMREDKHEAFTAYCAAIKRGDDHAVIMQAVNLYAVIERARVAREGKPHCTKRAKNWLRGRCYNNPPPPGAVIDVAGNVVAVEQEGDGGEDDFDADFAEFERDSGAQS